MNPFGGNGSPATPALIVASLATLAVPIAVRRMVDHGFSAEGAELVNSYFGVMIGVVAVLATASALRYYLVTTLGERIAAKARLVLREAEELGDMARAAGRPLSGEMRMSVIPTIAPFLLPRVLPLLRRDYPDLKLFLREEPSGPACERLHNGRTDCVLLAVQHIMKDKRPTLCLSGINRGANLGDDVTYSGTIAAAMEGTILGIRSIALSQQIGPDSKPSPRWQTPLALAPDILKRLLALESGEPDSVALEACMRAAHSLKGAARIVGLDPLVKLAHALEDLFVAALRGELAISPAAVDVLLATVDRISEVAQGDAAGLAVENEDQHVDRVLGEHLGGHVDAGDFRVGAKKRQRQTGADADFEDPLIG